MFSKWGQLLSSWRRTPDSAAVTVSSSRGATAAAAQHSAIDIGGAYLQMLLDSDQLDSATISVPEKLVGQVVEQQLRDSEQRNAAVPRLPTVIPLLLKQLRDPNASARDYVAIIKQDPVVAAAVLKVANSAYFNPYRKPLDNFERAVAALGIHGLRMVLSTAMLQPILQGRGDPLPQRVWDHSVACAVCCQQLAEREGQDSFKAYLTGLVHDIGVVTLYNQLLQVGRDYLGGQKPSPALMAQLFAQWSAPLTFWIAQDWQFPTEIVRALAAQSERVPDAPLAQILQRANRLSEAYLLQRAGLLDVAEMERLAAAAHCPDNLLQLLDSVSSETLGRRA